MGTRATYLFIEQSIHTTIYIHWDGYPEGAAAHLWSIFEEESQRGNMATRLIRGNPQAEITTGHEGHGDTEYQYTIRGSGLNAKIEAVELAWDSDKGKNIFTGTVKEFILANPDQIEDAPFGIFADYKTKYGEAREISLPQAKRLLKSAIHHITVWGKNPSLTKTSANWQGCLDTIRACFVSFPVLVTIEGNTMLTDLAED